MKPQPFALLSLLAVGLALSAACDSGEVLGALEGAAGSGAQDGSGGAQATSGGSGPNGAGGNDAAGGPAAGGAVTGGSGAIGGSGAGGSGTGGAGTGGQPVGSGGGLSLPADSCVTEADCVACLWDTAPRNPGECYCPFCDQTVMSAARCQINEQAFKEQRCDKKACPAPGGACQSKQVACVNNLCVERVAEPPVGDPATTCEFSYDCESCQYPTAPQAVADCYCTNMTCPVALNRTTCAANEAAFLSVCGEYQYTQCNFEGYLLCPATAGALCAAGEVRSCQLGCDYHSAPQTVGDCYCPGQQCPVALDQATCASNESAWYQQCSDWYQQSYYEACYSQGNQQSCGDIPPGPRGCADYNHCAYDCRYATAPASPADCYCPQEQCAAPLNVPTCNANQQAWQTHCQGWATEVACGQRVPLDCPIYYGSDCNLQTLQCEAYTYVTAEEF